MIKLKQLLAPLREYLLHAVVTAAVILAAVGFGLQESTQNASKAEADRWRLPSIPAQVKAMPDDVAAVTALFLDNGGGKPKANAKAIPDQSWRFVGTARAGDRLTAVIILPKPAGALRLQQGAKLPNGEEIVAIENGVMRYTDESGPHEVRAFAEARASKEKK